MSAERITRMLVLRVMAVLVLHAAILWLLLPKQAETYSVAAALFGIAAGTVGLAMIWLKPLRRDAMELARILPLDASPSSDREIAPPVHEELEQAYYALMRLAQRARKMDEEGAVARAAIEEAEQLSASFLASMGHDLRGPLNNIVGFADLLVMENLGEMRGVRESQRPSVEIIRCAAQDLLALLEQMIAWARLQSGPLQLDRKPIKAADLIQQARAEAERRAASRSAGSPRASTSSWGTPGRARSSRPRCSSPTRAWPSGRGTSTRRSSWRCSPGRRPARARCGRCGSRIASATPG